MQLNRKSLILILITALLLLGTRGSGHAVHWVKGFYSPRDIALDVAGGKMYWTERLAGRIWRANLDGSGAEVFITGLVTPHGIALDLASTPKKIYWTDSNKIQRANLNGSNVEDIVTTGVGPSDIALDVAGGKMYWTEDLWGGTNKIRRANMDGTGSIEDLVTTPAAGSLALDLTNRKMYWTDEANNRGEIRRADLNGSNNESIFTLSNDYTDIRSLALDVADGKMYWVESQKIWRTNLDGTSTQDLVTGLVSYSSHDLALDVAGGKMYWAAESPGAIQRANMAVNATVEDLIKRPLGSPEYLALDVAGGKIYWTEWDTQKIRRANLDGTSVQDLVVMGQELSSGLALDVAGGKMYWKEDPGPAPGTNKIRRANLDGTNVQDLITTPGSLGLGNIALDVAGGKMYWIDSWDKIRRANLDGTSDQDLVTGLGSPEGLALDVAGGKMYWKGSQKIRRANMDGTGSIEDLVTGLLSDYSANGLALDLTNRKMYRTEWSIGPAKIQRADMAVNPTLEDLVTTGLVTPQDIALDVAGGKMYWTEWITQKIRRANLDGSNVEDVLLLGDSLPQSPGPSLPQPAPADGAGTLTVGWGYRGTANAPVPTTIPLDNSEVNASNSAAPLAAGSLRNVLQFTYTAVSGGLAVNMAGGRVRIGLPDGWQVPNRLVTVLDAADLLYDTTLDGTQLVDDKTLTDRVTFSADNYIIVKLGSEWGSGRSDAERSLTITFGDVTTPVPASLPETDSKGTAGDATDDVRYRNYEFEGSSSRKDGTLVRLAAQPAVRVGNILGDYRAPAGVQYTGRSNQLERKVAITPLKVYPGETNHKFTITFTAPGPMYGAALAITVPDAIGPAALNTANVDVSGKLGANLGAPVFGSNLITIPMTEIDKGQGVVVIYTRTAAVPVDASATTGSAFSATTDIDAGGSGAAVAVTKLTGGEIHTVAGSGRVDITPVSVEAGSQRQDITLTYTTYTKLSGVDIAIKPNGIVIDSTQKLQGENTNTYGYVSSSLPGFKISDAGDTITWTNIHLERDKTMKVTIRRVNIVAEAREWPWTATIGGTEITDDKTTEDVNEAPTLTVVKTSTGAVTFAIDGDKTFPAASQATIKFRFTATATAIRAGTLSFTIPSAVGSAPTKTEKKPGRVSVSGDATVDGIKAIGAEQLTISGRTVVVAVGRLDVGGSVTVQYGGDADSEKAVLHYMSGEVDVTGAFRVASDISTRTAGTVTITLGPIGDGIGEATLSPVSVEAGSNTQSIKVTFTAAGTMGDGKVSLEIPSGWGSLQTDPTKRNYVTTHPAPGSTVVSALAVTSTKAVATIGTLGRGGTLTFILGGGTTGANNGVEVQDDVGIVAFTIKSDGDGDDVFTPVKGTDKFEGRELRRNPDKLGKVYVGSAGALRINVTSASGGTGKVTVTDREGNVPAVRAADADVTLVFTYTPSQTIVDGTLRFTVPSGWSQPQVEGPGEPGYTEVEGVGLGIATDDDKFSVTIPIFYLDKTESITIIYGGTGAGRAVAAAAIGTNVFKFEVKGRTSGNFKALSKLPEVTVKRQGSGKGKAVLTVTDGDAALYAGDKGREVTVVYTAAGQMVNGKVRLTIPKDWSAPTAETVTIAPALGPEPALPPTFDGQQVMVERVNLDANGTVAFVYTGDVQPTVGTAVKFAVAVHGGLDSDAYQDVADPDKQLTVEVKEARPGSGSAEFTPKIVQAGATGVTLTFTYKVAGTVSAPKEFRVQVPASWTQPSGAAPSDTAKGTYTVKHYHRGALMSTSVEKLNPVGRDMVARVELGGLEVEAGDEIQFIYENADAPQTPEVSGFKMIFNGTTVADLPVRVQSTFPSQLSLSSAGTVSADADAMPLAVTVGLQDDAGAAVAMENDVAVTLTALERPDPLLIFWFQVAMESTEGIALASRPTGTFAMTADRTGTESLTVTIKGGEAATMVYYRDTGPGTATITATAPGLTMASHQVAVTTKTVSIDSVIVDPTLARTGDTVTVNVLGTSGKTATFSIGSIVTDKPMTEVSSGSYRGSFTVNPDQHTDGVYAVTVKLDSQTLALENGLTLDNTPPTVTVSAAPATVADGETVTIAATISDAGDISAVMADVSALDATQTDTVALTMGDDGTYSTAVTISDDNTAVDGSKSITVTAIDAAGNSGMGTAAVMLDNTLTYTSTIPVGTSLFHVPLDVEGLDTVGDLRTMLGDAVNLLIVYDRAAEVWNSRSDAVPITADLVIIATMGTEATVSFTGYPWDGGTSTIHLKAGANFIGLPVNDPRVTNVSDIAGLFDDGVVYSVGVLTADEFVLVRDAGDPGDGPVRGDTAYLVAATADATATLIGEGWSNDMTGAAPSGLVSYNVEGQTPVLDLTGSVIDEITGGESSPRGQGFRVKVKNLSTKAALNKVTSAEETENSSRHTPYTVNSYNMTFVDLKAGHAGRIGDVLEISADSPSPLIGVQPIRHIVTLDDVKNSRIQLEPLIAYEIPAETELLRNYPNPFNPETWIPYRLAEDADVSLTIYDVNGELVRAIDVGHQIAAVYASRAKAIYWDGCNHLGEQVASGVYFYSLRAGDFSATRKMVILK